VSTVRPGTLLRILRAGTCLTSSRSSASALGLLLADRGVAGAEDGGLSLGGKAAWGTSTARTIVASISPAAARLRLIILRSIIPSVAKSEKTTPIYERCAGDDAASCVDAVSNRVIRAHVLTHG
jgi:hypothetical protein